MGRRSPRWLGALALAVAALVPAAPAARADGGGSALVVLGDSFAANGFRWEADADECLRGETSWPNQLSRAIGIAGTADFVDRSCSGAAIESDRGYSLVRETLDAAEAGGFGPGTRMVAIQFGLNDDWGDEHQTTLWTALVPCVFNLADGCDREAAAAGRITDFRAVSGPAFAARIEQVVRYLRYYAPNARIVLVGYPELFPPGGDTVCLNILGAGAFVQPRGGGLIEYLDRIDAAQRSAAALLGIDFLDTRARTAGHGLCAAEPWLNGVLDPRADPVGLPFHPSEHGDAVLAAALHERYPR